MKKQIAGEDSGGQVRDVENVPTSVLFERRQDLDRKPLNTEDGASEKIMGDELKMRGVSSRIPMGVLARQFKAECERTGDPRSAWRALCQHHGLGNIAPPAEIRRIAGIKPVAAGMGTYDDPAEDPRSPEEAGALASRTHTAGRLVAEISEEIDWNTPGRRIVKSSRHKEAGFYEPWLDDLPEMQMFENDANFDPDVETTAVCELCGAPNATLDDDTGEYVCSNCRQQGAEIPAVASRFEASSIQDQLDQFPVGTSVRFTDAKQGVLYGHPVAGESGVIENVFPETGSFQVRMSPSMDSISLRAFPNEIEKVASRRTAGSASDEAATYGWHFQWDKVDGGSDYQVNMTDRCRLIGIHGEVLNEGTLYITGNEMLPAWQKESLQASLVREALEDGVEKGSMEDPMLMASRGRSLPLGTTRAAVDYGPYTGVASCPTCGKECTEERGQSGVYFCEDCANSQAGGPYFPGPKSGDQPQTASRREGWGSSYSRDPFWLTTKYSGECKQCHRPIARGEKAFYYPIGKRLLCDGPCGQAASSDFEMGKADEDFMNRAGSRRTTAAEDCQLCHGRLDEDGRCKDCGAKYNDNGSVSDMPPLDERWDDVKASRRTAGEPVGYSYDIGGGVAYACPECKASATPPDDEEPLDFYPLNPATMNGTERCENCGKSLSGDGVEASRKTTGSAAAYEVSTAWGYIRVCPDCVNQTPSYTGDAPEPLSADDVVEGEYCFKCEKPFAGGPGPGGGVEASAGDPLADKWSHGNGRDCLQSGGDASDAGTATASIRATCPKCNSDDSEYVDSLNGKRFYRCFGCGEVFAAQPANSGTATASYGDPDEGDDDSIPAESPMAPYNPDDYLPDDYTETPECPTCGGPGMELGGLGNLMHYRCRDCGMDFSQSATTASRTTAVSSGIIQEVFRQFSMMGNSAEDIASDCENDTASVTAYVKKLSPFPGQDQWTDEDTRSMGRRIRDGMMKGFEGAIYSSRVTAGTTLDLATNSAIVRSAETGEPFVVLDDPDTGGYRVARLEVWELQKNAQLENCRFVAAYENGAEMQRVASRKTAGPDPVWTPEKIEQRDKDDQPARDKWKSMNPDASSATSTAANTMSYEQWEKAVDDACYRQAGLSMWDLADCPYMDWYEDGVKPEAAAKRAIKRYGDED